ncbi:hypothetical protein AB0J52_36895, partial [Spirillospora sp. NPDC049652]
MTLGSLTVPDVAGAPLPAARGPLSEAVLSALSEPPDNGGAAALQEAGAGPPPGGKGRSGERGVGEECSVLCVDIGGGRIIKK